MLSPGRGEQVKGDFAAASKIGEVNLQTNSTTDLAGCSRPQRFFALALAGHISNTFEIRTDRSRATLLCACSHDIRCRLQMWMSRSTDDLRPVQAGAAQAVID